jgi:lactoylglutathione lyase/methylmalonyl-CoA/ethylmalonyl-CoA epimerase
LTVKLDHIGIAVRSIEDALKMYQEALGLEVAEVVTVPEQNVTVAFLPAGDATLELLEPTGEDTAVGRFINERGEGMHHICLEVEDIEAALERLKANGARLIDKTPRRGAHGRIAFVHPRSMHGVLLELVEHDR